VTLQVRTEPIDDARPLLDLLDLVPDELPFAFVRDGEGIVAGGVTEDLLVGAGPSRLGEARGRFTHASVEASVVDTVGVPGGGLVAVGAFTFDPSVDGSSLRIPRVVIGRHGGRTWRTTIESLDAGTPRLAAPSVAPRKPTPVGPGTADTRASDRPRYAGSTLDDTGWLEAVDVAIARIRTGELEKIVLARDLHLWSRVPFRVERVLAGLAARFPSCYTFRDHDLVGASPELLLRRTGRTVASRVLAGTAPRGGDPEEDADLGAALLASTKDRWEHDLAARSAADVLAPRCTALHVPDEPSLVQLDNVQHLGSDLTGELVEDLHILDLLDLLHPTAAVAGTPRAVALAHIPELERMSRGRYAGPIGWCTPDGDGEFAIALRCAELRGTRARLFAGAGVVADSLPEAELRETWLKLRAMTDALGAEPLTRP
jgi:menaquinone-specific isochorismate synthase